MNIRSWSSTDDELSEKVEENYNSIDTDLDNFAQIVASVREISSIGGPQHDSSFKLHVPRNQLVYRILDSEQAGGLDTENQFERLRESERPVFQVLANLEIFYAQRGTLWLAHTEFDGQSGLAGRVYSLAFERWMHYDDYDEDVSDDHWDLQTSISGGVLDT